MATTPATSFNELFPDLEALQTALQRQLSTHEAIRVQLGDGMHPGDETIMMIEWGNTTTHGVDAGEHYEIPDGRMKLQLKGDTFEVCEFKGEAFKFTDTGRQSRPQNAFMAASAYEVDIETDKAVQAIADHIKQVDKINHWDGSKTCFSGGGKPGGKRW
jgi:hypothetical protein